MKTAREMINALTEAGVTQQTLALSAEMSQATISQVAAGNSKASEDLYRAIYVIHQRLVGPHPVPLSDYDIDYLRRLKEVEAWYAKHPYPAGGFVTHSLRYEPPTP